MSSSSSRNSQKALLSMASINNMEAGGNNNPSFPASSSFYPSFRIQTAKRAPFVYLALTVLIFIGGIVLGGQLEGGQFGVDQQNNMTPLAVAGNAIVFAALILGAYMFGLTLIHTAQAYYAGYLRKRVAVTLLFSLLVGCAIGISVCAQFWVQYNTTWEQQESDGNEWPDYLLQLFAALIIPTLCLLTIATFTVFCTVLLGDTSLSSSPSSSTLAKGLNTLVLRIIHPVMASRITAVFSTVLVLGTCFAATMFMNPIWYTGYAFWVSGPASLPLTLPDGSTAFEGLITPIVIQTGDPNAVIQPNYLPTQIVFNLYLDAVVYFSVLVGILLLGAIASIIPSVRKTLHTRVRTIFSSFLPKYFNTFHLGATIGELIVTAAIAGLFSFWFWYWSSSNYRVSLDMNGTGSRWPRTMGHLTTLSMSLLTFPVTRNSPLTAAFGIPFERAVKFHRLLGRICWLAVTIHMILWQIRWIQDGNLWMNVFTLTNLTPSGNVTHPNNFTVPLAEFAWLLLTIALVIAGVLRRKSFEAFQYTHIVVLFFFLVGLVHAWGHWYYTAGGLLLWAWDKTLRLMNASAKTRVISLSHAAGITKLEIEVPATWPSSSPLSSFTRNYKPGQYAFLCIPAIDTLQWHPFSLAKRQGGEGGNQETTTTTTRGKSKNTFSSSTDDDESTSAANSNIFVFHIMNHGPKTWTGSLAEMALLRSGHANSSKNGKSSSGSSNYTDDYQQEQLEPTISLSVDGPYGNLGDYSTQEILVLVAGGIGITPLASVLIDIVNKKKAAATTTTTTEMTTKQEAAPRNIHLVWSVRDARLLTIYADLLNTIIQTYSSQITLHLHVTEQKKSEGKQKVKSSRSSNNNNKIINDDDVEVEEYEGATEQLLQSNKTEHDGFEISPQDVEWCTPAAAQNVLRIVKKGRPDVKAILQAAVNATKACDATRVSAFVCGPEPLIETVSDASFELGVNFHSEVFHW